MTTEDDMSTKRWAGRIKAMFRKTFGGSTAELLITVLGTDVRQVTKAHDMTFGLLLEGGGEAVLVDPGPDVAEQLWRHGPGPKAVKGVLLTHENHLTEEGLRVLKGLGCDVAVYSERRKTMAPATGPDERAPHLAVASCRVKALRVEHQPDAETCAFWIEAGDCNVLLVPHARALPPLTVAPDVILLGVGRADGSDPEYMGLDDLEGLDAPAFLVAYGSETWSTGGVACPDDVTPLRRGDRLAFSDGSVKVLREPEEDLVLAKGWVSMADRDGKPVIHVAGDPSETLQAKLAGLVGPELRSEVEFVFGNDPPAGSVELFDLCLKGAAPRAWIGKEPADGDRPSAVKGVVKFEKTPKSEATEWDADKAEDQVRKWASSDDSGDKETVDWEKYRKAFAWYDDEDPENFGSYKLIHCYVEDGELRVVWPALTAAASVLQGGRGGVDIPEEDEDGVKAHIGAHYEQFDETAPWDEEEEQE